MDKETSVQYTNDGNIVEEIQEGIGFCDSDMVLFLAKKKNKDRKNLVIHIIAYIIAFPTIFLLWNVCFDNYFSDYIPFFLLGFVSAWGVFIVSRIVLFLYPILRRKLIQYIKSRVL